MKKLLETGASVDASTADGSSQPLHQACTHGMANVARILLDKGADVNKRTKSDLAVAIASGLMEHLTEGKSSGATGSLLGSGDGRKGGSTPLMFGSSPELCVKVRGSSSMLLLGCLGDLLRFEKREIQVATFAPGRSSP